MNSGREKVNELRNCLVNEIKDKIAERLKDFTENKWEIFRFLDVTVWSLCDEDSASMITDDNDNISKLHAMTKVVLDTNSFDIKEAKKEWIKVKRIVKQKFMQLQSHQSMLWCRFLTSYKHLFPNISMLIEILLVLLASSSVVERGFSTLKRNLTDTRSSLSNKRLNAILVMKTNLPQLRNLIENCDETIISEAVKLYHAKKKWRCEIRENLITHPNDDEDWAFGPSCPKRSKIMESVVDVQPQFYEDSDSDSNIDRIA